MIILSKNNVFFGVSDTFMCNMIFTAKRYMYNKKIHNEPILLEGYKGYVNKIKTLEYQIAKENNRMDEWLEKWSLME